MMTMQNRNALDWLLAEKGGVCQMFGEQCCTYIPLATAPNGAFTRAMDKLSALREELAENSGSSGFLFEWFQNLGVWGANLVKMGITVIVMLVITCLLLCCVVPVLKKRW